MEASGETLSIFGLPQFNKVPKLITSKAFDQYRSAQDLSYSQDFDYNGGERQMYLFNLLFETNPLNQSCDSRVSLSFRPLKMVYDAQTIIKIMDIFTTQQSNVATQYVNYKIYSIINSYKVNNKISKIIVCTIYIN